MTNKKYTVSKLFKQGESKICLNCDAELAGRFCHACGQENIEHKENFWHLLKHVFEDITHFDSKLFRSIKPLLLNPSFLTKEYIAGKRAMYLNPIRMYIFLSFLCFFILFNISTKDSYIDEIKKTEKHNVASDGLKGFIQSIESIENLDSSDVYSLQEYDSLQLALPKEKRDGFLTNSYTRRIYYIDYMLQNNKDEFAKKVIETIKHNIPRVIFFLLPLFALLLKFLYRRHHIFFIDHAIFSLHYHSFVFLFLSIGLILSPLFSLNPMVKNVFSFLFIVIPPFYLYSAMHHFYKQKRAKTIIKYILLCGSYILLFAIGMTIDFFATVLTIDI